ncbi:MAG: tyrosine-type recombinase/integrase [Pseudomonadota bacterium]
MSLNIINAISLYLEDCMARAQSPATLEGKRSTLNQFAACCFDSNVTCITQISLTVLRTYQQFLATFQTRQKKHLDITTQRNKLVMVRDFCHRLYLLECLDKNPADRFEVPKRPRRLPDAILTSNEVDAIFQRTVLHREHGLRDRCILELYYSSAMRRAELSRMTMNDVDIDKSMVRINKGKGGKDRIVPIAPRTSTMLTQYVEQVRRKGLQFSSGNWLFLNNRNEQFTPQQLSSLVRKYVVRAGVDRKGACNLYRHTAATQMLENGADIRVIQQQLGHEDLSTTQVYTLVSPTLLIDTYHKTHPAALDGRSDAKPH